MEELARRMLLEYDNHCPGTIFSEPDFEMTLDEAYELQWTVAQLRLRRGEIVAGYKIGCVSESVQRQLGVNEPVFGHVWASEIYAEGVSLRLDRFASLAIEGEVAVRLADDGQSIASVFPVIELHNRVLRRPPGAVELVANNAIHAGIVKPEESTQFRLEMETITVFRDGSALGAAPATAFPGGPLESVERVQRHLQARGQRLAPGQIVLTGTPLPLFDVLSPQQIRVRASDGQEVSATFG
jgi:2-keto-4-pentenoate hydratase